jgi:hypothetical protein
MCIDGALTTYSVLLQPTNQVGEDDWQISIFGPEPDMTKIAQSEELVFSHHDLNLYQRRSRLTRWFG